MTTLAPSLVLALISKYRTLHALRVQSHAVAPRAELAALAARFPGALRELDRLPMATIEGRLQALHAVQRGDAELQPWMQLQVAYHGFMRAVLRIRGQLLASPRHGHEDDPLTCLAIIGYVPALDEPKPDRFDREALRVIAKPPRGRLNPWVIAQVAHDHAVTDEAVRDALFGHAAPLVR